MSKRYLHVVIDSFFSVRFAQIMQRLAPHDLHVFIMLQGSGSSDCYSVIQDLRRYAYAAEISDADLYQRIDPKWLKGFDRIFWHGCYHPGVIAFIIEKLNSDILEKVYYVPWGSEIERYDSENAAHYLSQHHYAAISKFKHYISEEFNRDRLKKMGISGTFLCRTPIFPHPLVPESQDIVEKRISDRILRSSSEKATTILVGHCASPSDNHINILSDLKRFSNENIFLVLPMSYQLNIQYREHVVNFLEFHFPRKFYVISDYMDPASYKRLLIDLNIDVLIYNQETFSGLGVSSFLALYGAKIIKNQSNIYLSKLRDEEGCTVYEYESIFKSASSFANALSPLPLDTALKNSRLIRQGYYNEESLLDNWSHFLKLG